MPLLNSIEKLVPWLTLVERLIFPESSLLSWATKSNPTPRPPNIFSSLAVEKPGFKIKLNICCSVLPIKAESSTLYLDLILDLI